MTQALTTITPATLQNALNETQIDPRLAMAAKVIQAMAGLDKDGKPAISADMALAAAVYQAGTGQVLGRDFYLNEKVGRMEGYRGVARDAIERGVGEVQVEYRSLTAEEAEDHEIQPGDTAVVCEVYQLRAWRMAQGIGKRYKPIEGVGVVRKIEKYDRKSTQRWNDGQRRYEQLPESQWRPAQLEGGLTWRKKAQNRAYKEAMRHVPGGLASAAEVLEEGTMGGMVEQPPATAKLTMDQALAWVREHMADDAKEGEFTIQPPPVKINLPIDAEFESLPSATNDPTVQGALAMAAEKRNGATPTPAPAPVEDDKPFLREPRPRSPDMAIAALRYAAENAKPEHIAKITNGRFGALVGIMDTKPFDTQMRHALLRAVFGVESAKDLTPAQKYALVLWSKIDKIDDAWTMSAEAITEYHDIVTMVGFDADEPQF